MNGPGKDADAAPEHLNITNNTQRNTMKSQDIAIVGILLAVGAIARLIATALVPSPIVPNFVIVFYCLAIMLIAPRFKEALGIGIVGGIISALISHSLFPPANLISEPIGALVCLAVFLALKEKMKVAVSDEENPSSILFCEISSIKNRVSFHSSPSIRSIFPDSILFYTVRLYESQYPPCLKV